MQIKVKNLYSFSYFNICISIVIGDSSAQNDWFLHLAQVIWHILRSQKQGKSSWKTTFETWFYPLPSMSSWASQFIPLKNKIHGGAHPVGLSDSPNKNKRRTFQFEFQGNNK